MDTQFDFIIVGAGPAGCSLGWKLSNAPSRPSVLLIEAGGENKDLQHRVDGNKWITRMTPKLNWGYNSTPQSALNDRVIALDRGKGLGGSSAINFSYWNVGPKDDFEEIARQTVDPDWHWTNVQRILKEIESYDSTPPAGFEKYIDADPKVHGHDGPLKIGFPKIAEEEVRDILDIFLEQGSPRNLDMGSGNPLGFALGPSSAYNATRSTAADLLQDCPSNLKIRTESLVHKVVIRQGVAKGIQLINGTELFASEEVILAAGAVDTPKILMHSGIGPENQLKNFGIEVIHDNPNVGQNLRDHIHCSPTYARVEKSSKRGTWFRDSHLHAAAMKHWEESRTGPLAEILTCGAVGFVKNEAVYQSKEFLNLAEKEKKFLRAPSIPSYEILIGGPSGEQYVDPHAHPEMLTLLVFLMNPQSCGSATLQSSDPTVPLLVDLNFLNNPFDERVAVEAMRDVLKVINSPAFQENTIAMVHGPKSSSDEDILAYWRERGVSTWHMAGTCKMGKDQKKDSACVDVDFKVHGVKNLRVADMSVYPFLPK
jgi:choline dehydrogenase-like flavoprotein